jgi:hypothetical protein
MRVDFTVIHDGESRLASISLRQAAPAPYAFSNNNRTLTLFPHFPHGTNLDGLNATNIPEFATGGGVTPSTVTTLVIEGDITGPQVSGIKSRQAALLKGLANVSLPDFTGTIPNDAFNTGTGTSANTWLKSISAPLATGIEGYAFYHCKGLAGSLDFSKVTTIATNAFYGCDALTGPFDFSELTTVGTNVFGHCDGLTGSFVFPKLITIEISMFNNCFNLKGPLDFPDATTIENNAFYGCSALTDVHVPKAYSFGQSTFRDVKNCTLRIDSPASKITFGTNCFNNASTITLQLGEGANPARPTGLPKNNVTWNGYTWKRIEAYQQP